MHKSQVEQEEGPIFLPGSTDPSSLSAALAGTVIPFPFQARSAAASLALEDAIETEEDSFQSLGSIAIRLVGAWSLPRISCWRAPEENEPASSLKSPAWEG